MDIYSKFDLHIHSSASAKSKTGDQAVVANSTINNLNVLIDKLIGNNVNIVSITDHNTFDSQLYVKFKEEESKPNCIMKVLPGIEIDLEINSKNVHVICLFDDTDPLHTSKIQEGLDHKVAYTIDELGAVLRKIGLNTILIAHQKCDYKSEKSIGNSLSNIGINNFFKFIGTDFFDALEIQNSKVEGILKTRFSEDSIDDFQLIVGSDCHEWSAYPAHHTGTTMASLQYMKALPTFQGIVMAITDYSRICNSIEPPKTNALDKICLKCNGRNITIPLSNNINVIIGDNSVGKSTLIKYLCNEAPREGIDFLRNHDVQLVSPPLDKNHYSYSGQGKIREMFESTEEKLPIRQKFIEHILPIDKDKYIKIINDIFTYYSRIWNHNEKMSNNKKSIGKFIAVPLFSANEKHYLNIEENIATNKNEFANLLKVFDDLYQSFQAFNEHRSILEKEDIDKLRNVRKEIYELGKKYLLKNKKIQNANEIINEFLYYANLYNQKIASTTNSDELSFSTYKKECQNAVTSICNDLEYSFRKVDCIWDTFTPFKIESSINQKGRYCFIDKPNFENAIDGSLIKQFIKKQIVINKDIDTLTTSEILSSIKGKTIYDKAADNINQFVSILKERFVLDYFSTTVEIKRGNDKLNESNSAGVNALYYIDILSETFNKPIFIIDQPEDDVSQSRISKDIIPSLKCLAKKAQILLITHNPQLVVNLDADNVIILKKNETQIDFYSGALEYSDDQFSILDLVAKTLDGGTDVIKKRWKRYVKTDLQHQY